MSEIQQTGQTFTLIFVWVGLIVLIISAINALDSGKTWGKWVLCALAGAAVLLAVFAWIGVFG